MKMIWHFLVLLAIAGCDGRPSSTPSPTPPAKAIRTLPVTVYYCDWTQEVVAVPMEDVQSALEGFRPIIESAVGDRKQSRYVTGWQCDLGATKYQQFEGVKDGNRQTIEVKLSMSMYRSYAVIRHDEQSEFRSVRFLKCYDPKDEWLPIGSVTSKSDGVALLLDDVRKDVRMYLESMEVFGKSFGLATRPAMLPEPPRVPALGT